MYLSMAHSNIETLPSVNTFADGIAVKTPGELTFELCGKYVDEIITVTDDETATAILQQEMNEKAMEQLGGAMQQLDKTRKAYSLDEDDDEDEDDE